MLAKQKNHSSNIRSRLVNNRKLLVAVFIAACIIAVGTVFAVRYFSRADESGNNHEGDVTTTSTAPSAQADFTDGSNRDVPAPSNQNEGTVTDRSGSIGSIPPQDQWMRSQSGEIAVYSPIVNSILSNGDTLAGESSLDTISFRLIDNVSGVIARGQLPVVGGRFSGVFNFTSSGSQGRVDVFGARPDGVEFSIIEIPIRLK